MPAGLLLQRHCGGCAVTVFMDVDYHPEHSGEVSWYGRHTGNFTGPHGGLQVLQQLIYIICCVFVTQTLVLHSFISSLGACFFCLSDLKQSLKNDQLRFKTW